MYAYISFLIILYLFDNSRFFVLCRYKHFLHDMPKHDEHQQRSCTNRQDLSLRSLPISEKDHADVHSVISRFLELEAQRKKQVSYQLNYQRKVARDDPEKVKAKRQKDVARRHERYHNDPEYRSKVLLDNKRERNKKKSISSDV